MKDVLRKEAYLFSFSLRNGVVIHRLQSFHSTKTENQGQYNRTFDSIIKLNKIKSSVSPSLNEQKSFSNELVYVKFYLLIKIKLPWTLVCKHSSHLMIIMNHYDWNLIVYY